MIVNKITNLIPACPMVRNAGVSGCSEQPSALTSQQELWKTSVKKDMNVMSEKYSSTIMLLTDMNNDAQSYLNEEVNTTGWIGKSTDFIFDLVGSKNNKKDLKDSINQNKSNIEKLAQAGKDGNFEAEFFNLFGVNYDKEAVQNFEKVYDKNVKINHAKEKEKKDTELLGKYIEYFSEENLEDIKGANLHNSRCDGNIDKNLHGFEKALATVIGSKEQLDEMYQKQRDYGESERDGKIEFYRDLAQTILHQDKEKVETLTGKSSNIDLSLEYNRAYKKAFGTKNNVNKEVVDYSLIQRAREYVFSTVYLECGLKGLSLVAGKVGPVVQNLVSVSSSIGMEATDITTRRIDNHLDKNKVKEILVNAFLSLLGI